MARNSGSTKVRGIGDAVSYAIASGPRIEMLALLNERTRTQGELAKRLKLTQSQVSYYISELLRSGSIEEVDSERVGNLEQHRYRALKRGEYTVADYREMTEEEQKATVGITLQNSIAEHLAAFRAGKMRGDDPNLVVLWDWFNVDEEGRGELTAEMEESWARLQAIVSRSVDRRNRSKETAQSIIISFIGHPRVRPVPGEPGFEPLVDAEQ